MSSQVSAARVRSNIVLLMFGLSIMSYVDRTIMSIAGPTLIKEFGLSETQMGSVYSAFILSYAVLMAPGGWLADGFGPRLVLALASGGAALFTALTAAAGRPGLGSYLGIIPSFLIVRLAFGACTAPLYPACGRMTAKWISLGRRARVQGFVLSGAPLGGALTPILFSWLITRYGWRNSLCLAAGVTAVLALVWFWYARDRPSEYPSIAACNNSFQFENESEAIQKKEPISWATLLTNRNLLLLTVGYFALDYFEYIFFYWMYYYLGEIRHMGASQSAVYTTALLLTMMAMMPLGGWVADRLIPRFGPRGGRRLVAVTGMILSALLMYLSTTLTHTLAVVTLLSLALGFASSSEGPFWASAIEAGGRHSGAAGGILNAGGNFGGLLAPVLTPYIASHVGWTWGLHVASLIVLVGAASWFFMEPARPLAQAGGAIAQPEGESL